MNAPRLAALVFDVDGTLADTEHAHLAAFNQAFAQAGLPWQWDLAGYTRLLEVAGGRERIRHHWRAVDPAFGGLDAAALEAVIVRLHAAKSAAYEAAVTRGEVRLRPGVLSLIHEARQAGLALAIATTTSTGNIEALLGAAIGSRWREIFPVVEDAATAPRKKPDPQAYRQAVARLGLPAARCLAIEDSANGLRAARAAGLPVLVTPNEFTRHHEFGGAWRVLTDLADMPLASLMVAFEEVPA